MAVQSTSKSKVGFRELGFGIVCLASVVLTVVAQFVWLIVFDEIGLDSSAPDFLFMQLLPALTLALIPAIAARYLYTRKISFISGITIFLSCLLFAFYTGSHFGLG